MSNYNKVILLGRLTRDPELRVGTSGVSICRFSLAVSRKYKGADGSPKEEVAFIDIDAFGSQAEVISKYCMKGDPLFVEGRLKLDQWESQGEKRSKLGVVLESFQFMGGKRHDEEEGGYEGGMKAARQPAMGAGRGVKGGEANMEEDDIPF